MRAVVRLGLALSTLCGAAQAWAVPCANLPVLFILQDRSGSMSESPDPSCPGCPSKWDSSATAIATLTTKYANRFDFALELFPEGDVCGTGSVVAPFPSTADVINDDYKSTYPSGGTPTAWSLTSAKTYLQSLHLSVNAYVLLITDGEPNCNLALDGDTCECTLPANQIGGCTNQNCLDDLQTESAAAAVKAAGFPIYVVGFGATAASNQAVLNAIAQAGGTGQAYSATNQASLTATIEAIAGQVAGCCRDACTGSEAKCGPNGDVLHCATDAEIGCNTWVSSNCLPESVCSNGSCIACQNSCAVGKVYCGNGKVQTCVAGPNGCNVLQNARDCGWGELCDSGSCTTPCTDECTEGAGKCGGGIPSQCVRGASSCTKWQAEPACPASQPCVQGGCRSACSGGEIETCAVGYVCTHVAEGAVCVPRPSPSPSPDAGQGLDPGSSQPPKPSPSKTGGSSTSEVGGAGCGCGAGGAASLAALWPLLLLAWRRKQR